MILHINILQNTLQKRVKTNFIIIYIQLLLKLLLRIKYD